MDEDIGSIGFRNGRLVRNVKNYFPEGFQLKERRLHTSSVRKRINEKLPKYSSYGMSQMLRPMSISSSRHYENYDFRNLDLHKFRTCDETIENTYDVEDNAVYEKIKDIVIPSVNDIRYCKYIDHLSQTTYYDETIDDYSANKLTDEHNGTRSEMNCSR